MYMYTAQLQLGRYSLMVHVHSLNTHKDCKVRIYYSLMEGNTCIYIYTCILYVYTYMYMYTVSIQTKTARYMYSLIEGNTCTCIYMYSLNTTKTARYIVLWKVIHVHIYMYTVSIQQRLQGIVLWKVIHVYTCTQSQYNEHCITLSSYNKHTALHGRYCVN